MSSSSNVQQSSIFDHYLYENLTGSSSINQTLFDLYNLSDLNNDEILDYIDQQNDFIYHASTSVTVGSNGSLSSTSNEEYDDCYFDDFDDANVIYKIKSLIKPATITTTTTTTSATQSTKKHPVAVQQPKMRLTPTIKKSQQQQQQSKNCVKISNLIMRNSTNMTTLPLTTQAQLTPILTQTTATATTTTQYTNDNENLLNCINPSQIFPYKLTLRRLSDDSVMSTDDEEIDVVSINHQHNIDDHKLPLAIVTSTPTATSLTATTTTTSNNVIIIQKNNIKYTLSKPLKSSANASAVSASTTATTTVVTTTSTAANSTVANKNTSLLAKYLKTTPVDASKATSNPTAYKIINRANNQNGNIAENNNENQQQQHQQSKQQNQNKLRYQSTPTAPQPAVNSKVLKSNLYNINQDKANNR
jgi:hypothetical protein